MVVKKVREKGEPIRHDNAAVEVPPNRVDDLGVQHELAVVRADQFLDGAGCLRGFPDKRNVLVCARGAEGGRPCFSDG